MRRSPIELTFATLFLLAAVPDPPEVRQRLGAMGQHSYETGCLHAAQDICAELSGIKRVDECRKESLIRCEDAALRFRRWLDSGSELPKTPEKERVEPGVSRG